MGYPRDLAEAILAILISVAAFAAIWLRHCWSVCGGVVQLVRVPACHAGGRGFESRPCSRLACRDSALFFGNRLKLRGTDGYHNRALELQVTINWTMNGPRNGLRRETAKALTYEEPNNLTHPALIFSS